MRYRLTIRLRLLTALIAVAVAAAHAPKANGQVVQGGPPPIVQPGAPDGPMAGPVLDEQRLQNVESQLNQLLESQNKRDTATDQKPTFDLGGQIQVDYIYPGQDAANRATVGDAQDALVFRRARITGRGEAYEVIEYAIGFDFALPGRPSFLDNYIAIRELPLLGEVRVGHYFEPFSLERFTQNRYNTFMERSLADTFAPSRNTGIMAHRTVGELERGTWTIGWFRTSSDFFGDDFGDTGEQAVTARATWLPIYDEADERYFVHVGGAFSYRTENERELRFATRPEVLVGNPLPAPPNGIPLFVDTDVIPAFSDQRLGAELAIVRGPLYLQAEYMCSSVDQIGGERLFFHGAYGYVSYFLTGENRTYNKQLGTLDRVYPHENFFRVVTDQGVATGRGAWEVAARWSFIDLDDANVQGGTLNDVTLALNWHLNPYTRMRWEYIHARLDRAPVGPSNANIFGMRFDVDF